MFAQIGITLLGLVVLGLLIAMVGLDMWLELNERPPLGQLIAKWSRRYPLFAAGLTWGFGALLGHFFWP